MPNIPTANNNPGDLKDPSTGNFQTFGSSAEGKAALYNDLTAKMNGKLGSGSLIDFSKTYAPASDGNNPIQYAANLANKLGVSPDTKLGDLKGRIDDFADAVSQNEGYQAPSGGYETKAHLPKAETQTQRPDNTEPTFGQQMSSRFQQAGQALTDAGTGKINPLSGILQTGGAIGGAVGDITNDLLGHIPFVKDIEGKIGQGVGALANTGAGKAVTGAYSSLPPEWQGNIAAAGNIATVIPVLKGLGLAKEAIGGALGKSALEGIAEDVAPTLGAKGTAQNVAKQGLMKTLIKGEIKQPITSGARDIAQTVSDNVPGFSKLGTYSEKINATQQAVYKMADDLKQQVIDTGSDRLYSFKELQSRLNNLEQPLMLKTNNLDAVYQRVIAKAMEISKGNGGTISSLFDSRKMLDNYISREIPNLYSSDAVTPMRLAVRNIRGAMNDFIQERLPSGSGFKNSLQSQSRLFDAIDNLSPKAAKEIGTTRYSRFVGRHPRATGLIGGALKYGAVGAGVGGAYELGNYVSGK